MGDDDDGIFNLFGGGDEEEEDEVVKIENIENKNNLNKKLKHDGCPFSGDDPKDAKVRVKYEADLFSAIIKSYESDSNTYTIVWSDSGVLQYRTKPEDINWDFFEEKIIEKEKPKVEEDELWLAARRGSLKSVKNFIEIQKIDFNETGKNQQRTPFYHAVFCGHVQVVEYLLSLGAQDSDGTAFITANAEVREVLTKAGLGKRRASIRKSFSNKPITVNDIQSLVTNSQQLKALRDLELRLEAAETSMRAEMRRASIANKSLQQTTSPSKRSSIKNVTFENSNDKTKQVKKALVVRKKKSNNLIFRFFTSMIPKRLLFGRSTV